MTTLRSKLIRLAHSNPELRADILPLIWETQDAGAGKTADFSDWDGTLKWARLTTAARSSLGPRESWLPSNDPTFLKLHTPPGLEIFRWERKNNKGEPITQAIAFTGKSDKPIWNYLYKEKDEAALQNQVRETVNNFTAIQSAKKKKQDDRRNFTHELKVDDILYSSWGYDQTNIDWYQVTKVIGKQVVIREIAGKIIQEGQGSDTVMPSPNHFIGPEMKKTPSGGDYGSGKFVRVRLNTFSSASLWDGKPKHQTSSGFGH